MVRFQDISNLKVQLKYLNLGKTMFWDTRYFYIIFLVVFVRYEYGNFEFGIFKSLCEL